MIDTAELTRWQPPMFDNLTISENFELFEILSRGADRAIKFTYALLGLGANPASLRVTAVAADINELLHDLNDARRVMS